ncbi:unnamed protein product [Triticum turgidum subsp. durum]|uniref:DUF6598 domain-containing protein n=1 Tax=Triticum turgidum subsp. durum TaxID=4567 RepID=A0A9R1S9B0_TRITD|nr:unnamed protein product [Triticum turgidum subsp. durum]
MLNYVLNHSKDDPVIMHKLVSPLLIEFDIRIKNGEREEDDEQLVDGAITCNDCRAWKPVKQRIKGDCGAVDISMTCVENALEATTEVAISEVRSGFSLSLRSFIYVLDDEYEEIQLFHGAIDRPCRLGRFVVAITWGDVMVLKFRLGGEDGVERRRSFKSQLLACSSRRIKHELANIFGEGDFVHYLNVHRLICWKYE